MWIVEADQEKNRIYILMGKIHEDDFIQFFFEVDQATQEVAPEFSLIIDIRMIQFDSTPSLLTWDQKLQELLALRKIGKAVRIINDDTKKLHMEFDRASRAAGFRAIPVKTLTEALNLLNS